MGQLGDFNMLFWRNTPNHSVGVVSNFYYLSQYISQTLGVYKRHPVATYYGNVAGVSFECAIMAMLEYCSICAGTIRSKIPTKLNFINVDHALADGKMMASNAI